MSGAVYGGDEIGALVFDVGSNTVRLGYSGEEAPRFDIPTAMGLWRDSSDGMRYKCNIGVVAVHVKKPNMEVTNCIKDGMVDDWSLFENMLDHLYSFALHTESEKHPILITEPAWITTAKREDMTELLFEKYKIPAMYSSKTPSLVAFANGRATCLVIDSGAVHTSAVPVHDGHIMGQAIVKSPAGGDYIGEQCLSILKERGIDVIPPYMIRSKEFVRPDEPPNWKSHILPPLTTSWHNYMAKEVVQDFQASVLHVCDNQYDEEACKTMPAIHYEFPNGFHRDFGTERFKIAEALFNLTARNGYGIQPTLDISSLVTTSIGMCEMEQRPLMYSNVVVTGGNSNLQGFTERLTRDLQAKVPPSMRLKVITQAGGVTERRFAAWLGGSILSSLGSFQPLWISKQEYEENGKSVIRLRC